MRVPSPQLPSKRPVHSGARLETLLAAEKFVVEPHGPKYETTDTGTKME